MDDFTQIWKIYKEAFPDNERRSVALQKEVLNNPKYQLKPIYVGQAVAGLLAYWDLADFIFIEHYAIDHKYRRRGYGTKYLKKFLIQTNKKVILEVEKPETVTARKRIKFYERLHFHVNPIDYVQPAYDGSKAPVSLLLMTYPHAVSESTFYRIKSKLYQEVYGVPKNLYD